MNRATFAPLCFDSAALPVAEQFPTFASAMVNFDVTRAGAGGFAARAQVWRIGALILTEVRAEPARYFRDMARIIRDRVDHLYVNLHLSGGAQADCGQGMRNAGAGSLLVIDMAQPCAMVAEDRHTLSLAIPRHLLMPRLDPLDPHGMIVEGGLVPLLAAQWQSLCGALSVTPRDHASAIGRMMLDLLVETLQDALRARDANPLRSEALPGRVRAYLDAHLGSPLDVGTICRDLGVSRSGLYRACAEGGGVVRLLQQRRLRRMRALLEDRGETRSIAALAATVGFRDSAHLSRLFKRTFGVTPNEFRARGGQPMPDRPPAGHDAARLFGNWISDLQ